MPRQLMLQTLTIFVVGSGFASVALSDDPRERAERRDGDRIQVQIRGEQAGTDGGLVIQLGEDSNLWLGLSLEQEDGALEVQQVLPGSPAEKAGIKPHDVLLASGKTGLKDVADLRKLVHASGGKPISLKLQRDGKEIVVDVKPERSPGGQIYMIEEKHDEGKADPKHEERLQMVLRQLNEQVRKQAEAGKTLPASGWQVMHAGGASIPDDMEITIKKKGNHPTRIKVRQGVQTWSVNEHELNKLPEPIRGHVSRLLPGHAQPPMMPGASIPQGASPSQGPDYPAPLNPGGGMGAYPPDWRPGKLPQRDPDSQEDNRRLQKEVQRLQHQLHELTEQVEAMRRN